MGSEIPRAPGAKPGCESGRLSAVVTGATHYCGYPKWLGWRRHEHAVIRVAAGRERPGDLLATNLAALKQQWIAAGKSVRTENLEGIKFSEVTLSTNATIPFASVFPTTGGSLARQADS